jgi:general L-amino acid transport system permease protein
VTEPEGVAGAAAPATAPTGGRDGGDGRGGPRGRGLVRVVPPVLRDVRVLRVLLQVLAVALVVGFVAYLADNYQANLQEQGLRSGWGFLDEPTGFDVGDVSGGDPVRDAIWQGVRNTLGAALVGMVLATVLGLVVGVIRLSQSWPARKATTLYVEVVRNVPVLLIILFVNAGLATLPRIDDARSWGSLAVWSNREVAVLSPVAGDALWPYLGLLGVAALAGLGVAAWRTRLSDATGSPHHRVLWGGGLLVVVTVIGYLVLDGPVTLSRPSVEDRAVTGGAALEVAYVALTGALVLYHGSHIAEIVRGSIQAVPYGQSEAASAVGLSDFQRMRYVILPQALRIAVPPTINQHLSLAKNTSLGIAVAYSDVASLGQRLIGSSRAPAVQMMAVLMGIYLVISLTTSLVLNLFNRRVQLVER